MVGVVSEFAELAFLPGLFKVLNPEDLPKKACKTKDSAEIIDFKNYIWDLAIVWAWRSLKTRERSAIASGPIRGYSQTRHAF
jgi:hypothetical protein